MNIVSPEIFLSSFILLGCCSLFSLVLLFESRIGSQGRIGLGFLKSGSRDLGNGFKKLLFLGELDLSDCLRNITLICFFNGASFFTLLLIQGFTFNIVNDFKILTLLLAVSALVPIGIRNTSLGTHFFYSASVGILLLFFIWGQIIFYGGFDLKTLSDIGPNEIVHLMISILSWSLVVWAIFSLGNVGKSNIRSKCLLEISILCLVTILGLLFLAPFFHLVLRSSNHGILFLIGLVLGLNALSVLLFKLIRSKYFAQGISRNSKLATLVIFPASYILILIRLIMAKVY